MNYPRMQRVAILAAIVVFFFAWFALTANAQVVFPARGGTGTSTVPTLGQLLMGQSNGTYAPQATSTLGLLTTDIIEGAKLFYTDARVASYLTSSTTLSAFLNYWTKGGSALYYTGGNVGIGTSTPQAVFHTQTTGTGHKTGLIIGRNTANVGDLSSLLFNVADLGDQGAIDSIPTGATAADITFRTRASSALSERVRITSAGNVGIGTTTPATALQLWSGQLAIPDGSATLPALVFNNQTNMGFHMPATNQTALSIGGITKYKWTGTGFELTSDKSISFRSASNGSQGSSDTFLWRNAADFVEMRDGTDANQFGVYNTYTSTSQYERAIFGFQQNANVLSIGTQATGTGVVRNIALIGGNVGIGETAPTEKLVVAGQGTGRMLVGDLGFGDGYTGLSMSGVLSQTNYNFLGSPNQLHFWINRASGGELHFREANVTQMMIDGGGNVGIATLVPSEKLVVAGSINANSQSSSFIAGGTRVFMDLVTSSKLARLGTLAGGDTLSGAEGELGIYVKGSERVRIDANGNVGIGTTSPSAKLHLYDANSPVLRIQDSTNNVVLGAYAQNSNAFVGTISNSLLNLGINNAAVISIAVGGNVGIGTTTPGSLLDLFSTGTTTMRLDSNSATQGSCLALKDSDGGGYTYVTSLDGVLSASITPCS